MSALPGILDRNILHETVEMMPPYVCDGEGRVISTVHIARDYKLPLFGRKGYLSELRSADGEYHDENTSYRVSAAGWADSACKTYNMAITVAMELIFPVGATTREPNNDDGGGV